MRLCPSRKSAAPRRSGDRRDGRCRVAEDRRDGDLGAFVSAPAADAHAALLGVQALFGSLPVIGKVVLAVIPAVSLVGFRVGITALILIAVQAYRRRFWLQYREDYRKLAVLSLFGVTFNQLLFIILMITANPTIIGKVDKIPRVIVFILPKGV